MIENLVKFLMKIISQKTNKTTDKIKAQKIILAAVLEMSFPLLLMVFLSIFWMFFV